MLKCSWVRKFLDEFIEEKSLGVSKFRFYLWLRKLFDFQVLGDWNVF